jgi:replicative DNA helicase
MNNQTPAFSLPASRESEVAILGAVLLENKSYWQAAAELAAEDFSLDSHRRIYAHMSELAEAGKPIDFVTLTERLGQRQELDSVGGTAYVMSLTDGLPRVKNIEQYVNIVKDKSRRRKFLQLCAAGTSAAYDPAEPTRHCLELVQDGLLDIEANFKTGQASPVKEFSEDVFAQLEAQRACTGELVGHSTGVRALDQRTTGIRRRELWVIGGRPGDGKTSLALQILSASAAQKVPVGMFSIEMDKTQVLHRLWSAQGQIKAGKLRNPKRVAVAEWARLRNTLTDVSAWPLFIDDSSAISIGELSARARLMIRRSNVSLIVVDYVQIVDAPGRDERHRVTAISRVLRMLAKEENVAVVALSQMTRPSDKNMNSRPTKFDLKESGSLEADAHTVLLIYRPVDEFNQYNGEDEIIVDKQRHGARGIEPVVYDEHYLRFRERSVGGEPNDAQKDAHRTEHKNHKKDEPKGK